MNKKFLETTWISKILDNNLILVPQNIKRIKIDVGLAGDAPNSALWLSDDTETFVIGIEPLDYHWKHIEKLGSPDNNEDLEHPNWKILQLSNNSVQQKRNKICSIDDRFAPLKLAISNVDSPTSQTFYLNSIGNTGSSSLVHPSKRIVSFEKEITVDVCSLEYILNLIPWDRFDYIEHIKTDCEGLDFEVVKSIGKFLHKIVFITSELDSFNPKGNSDFIDFMKSNGFSVSESSPGNVDFKNERYNDIIIKNNITNLTLRM